MNEIKAIPTTYNGIEYRSRLESDTAMLLDLIKTPFEYEAKSFLLQNGRHYRPDFLLHGGAAFLEVRGYESPDGNAQIRTFCTEVYRGVHGPLTYAVLTNVEGLPRFAWFNEDDNGFLEGAIDSDWGFAVCECGAWYLARYRTCTCQSCGCTITNNNLSLYPQVSGGKLVCTVVGDDRQETVDISGLYDLVKGYAV